MFSATILAVAVTLSEFCAPAVTGQVHASTLMPLKAQGDVLVAWFEGPHERHPRVAIRGAVRRNGRWGAVRTLAKVNPTAPHWNPVLRRADDGRLDLYFKVGRNCVDWRTYVTTSRDEGETWSESHELVVGDVGGGRGPVKNKCLRLASGRWLAPASTEIGVWRAFADISDDDGRTWRASPPFPVPKKGVAKDFGVIQPSFWEDAAGVHAFLRSNDGWIWRSDSRDGGETWSTVSRTTLENVNSGLDVVRASNGKVYLVRNGRSASNDPKNGWMAAWGTRNHLELCESSDGGATWRTVCTLAEGPVRQPDGRLTEFSYPAVVEATPGVLAVTFTYNRRAIAYRAVGL